MQLEARKIGFYYKKNRWIFRDLNFTIDAGEIVGLIGPSGCGKTTFGRVLSGYEKPQEGTILLNETPLPKRGYQPVQLVYQHPEKAVNPKWRMEKTLHEGGEIDRELLEVLGIKQEWLSRWPNELSGGELQRFCVARALRSNTRFLIADEMTTMLDAITQSQIWHAVLDIVKQRNIGVLAISHEAALLKRICTRTLTIH
ncbi:ABC transporter ATP-binding protein [Halalkalibacter kiskunsagensis]|uniref:ABC transporter ATP-binding protein n=1 Tax=Halalkalibacter kiskunsagensis TaxID=1548599 RepID=A0ABV6KG62_9BACI